MFNTRTLLAVFMALGLALFYACGTTGKVGIGKEKGTGKIWFEASGSWGVSGPANMCGCLTWTDENGKPLEGAAQGEIKNGSGGGVVPPGAKGWQIEIVPCSEFDGCDNGTDTTSPSPWYRFYGVRVVGPKLLSFDVTVASPDGAEAANSVLEAVLAGASAGPNVDIAELSVATPRYVPNAAFRQLDGVDVVTLDTEPILLSRLSANGHTPTISAGLAPDPDGYYRAVHFVPAADLDLSLGMTTATHNVFQHVLGTAHDGTEHITLDVSWRP